MSSPRRFRSRGRLAACRGASVAAALGVLAGCSSGQPAGKARPTEAETREAYLDTPVIVDDQGRAVERGTRKADLFEHLGRSVVSYHRGSAECVVYPIVGTQRRDEFGSPVADEWEFCFNGIGSMTSKRRLEAAVE